ncbi:hypothetical protein BDA99DRAFT_246222 [Phascolomyces articulosus]|uniref:Uncharacterized protein n=1 Tax=Phascolomyces articulosus TaxID=60185 RepID=A0AAD5PK27_9FUNG|nr:hypothetical protein BDA99DRAFT_246222 [Phascolomyces articulosus]
MQMLDILDILIASLPDRNEVISRADTQSELTYYRRVASLLDIVFRQTKLELKDHILYVRGNLL